MKIKDNEIEIKHEDERSFEFRKRFDVVLKIGTIVTIVSATLGIQIPTLTDIIFIYLVLFWIFILLYLYSYGERNLKTEKIIQKKE